MSQVPKCKKRADARHRADRGSNRGASDSHALGSLAAEGGGTRTARAPGRLARACEPAAHLPSSARHCLKPRSGPPALAPERGFARLNGANAGSIRHNADARTPTSQRTPHARANPPRTKPAQARLAPNEDHERAAGRMSFPIARMSFPIAQRLRLQRIGKPSGKKLDGKIKFLATENLAVRAERYSCAKCATDLGSIRDNYKLHCVRYDRPIEASNPIVGDPRRFIFPIARLQLRLAAPLAGAGAWPGAAY